MQIKHHRLLRIFFYFLEHVQIFVNPQRKLANKFFFLCLCLIMICQLVVEFCNALSCKDNLISSKLLFDSGFKLSEKFFLDRWPILIRLSKFFAHLINFLRQLLLLLNINFVHDIQICHIFILLLQ